MKRIDLMGQRKGRLTITGYSHSHVQPSGQKRAIWNAICDCGTVTQISTGNWSTGAIVSCGCYFKELCSSGGPNRKESGSANLNYKFLSYRARARSKKWEFSLTKEEFKNIVLQDCHYCGSKPVMHHTSRSYNGLFISNGIDRKDSKNGYVVENCLPCCKHCNIMKNNMSYEEFLKHIQRIHDHASSRIRL